MNEFDFFDRKVCLTHEGDEWEIAKAEFERVGLTNVQKFQSLWDIGPHQSFNRSVKKIILDFYQSTDRALLHLEDDCVFKDLSHLSKALSELPSDWDIVYLGANLQGTVKRYSDHLFHVTSAWTTHAIGYSRRALYFLVNNQPDDKMYDNWLSDQLPTLNAFVIAPMVAWQRPRFSSIWKVDANYDDLFAASEELLK